jgi:glycosyltransferase involved in cell wall biosynthesis
MRIVFVLSTISGRGGPQRFMIEVGKRLEARGHKVYFYTWHFDPQLTFDEYKSMRVKHLEKAALRAILGAVSRRWRTSSPQIMKLPVSIFTNPLLILKAIVEVKPDALVISSGHTFAGLVKLFYNGILVCRYASLPRTLANSMLARLLRPFEVYTIKRSISFINSHRMANLIQSMIGIKMPVIHPGVDYEKFSSIVEEGDGKTLLCFSQIRPNKNQLFLINLMPLLLKKCDARLVLAGEVEREHMPYLRMLERTVEKLGLIGKVLIITDVGKYGLEKIYSDATVYLHPAKGEPFGMTVVEAMACGKPVIVHRTVGAAEIVGDGGCGFLVGDKPEEWVDCIVALLNNKRLYREMARKAKLSALELSWDKVTEKFEALLACAVQKK